MYLNPENIDFLLTACFIRLTKWFYNNFCIFLITWQETKHYNPHTEQFYKSIVSLICRYLALWRRIMCPLMFPFNFALYLQNRHWNCGSLPHSNFKWLISDVLNWYVRPQSGHTSLLSWADLFERLDAFPDFCWKPWARGSHSGSPYSKSLA